MMIMEIDKLEQKRVERAKKNILWFGIISLTMSFAGLTSAYVVSKERPDWITDFQMPPGFYISLGIILISSLTIHMAKVSIRSEERRVGKECKSRWSTRHYVSK